MTFVVNTKSTKISSTTYTFFHEVLNHHHMPDLILSLDALTLPHFSDSWFQVLRSLALRWVPPPQSSRLPGRSTSTDRRAGRANTDSEKPWHRTPLRL